MSLNFSGFSEHTVREFGKLDKEFSVGCIFCGISLTVESFLSGVVDLGTDLGGEKETAGDANGAEAVEFIGIKEDFGFNGAGAQIGSEAVLSNAVTDSVSKFCWREVFDEEITGNLSASLRVVNFSGGSRFKRPCNIMEDGSNVNNIAIGMRDLITEFESVFDNSAGMKIVMTVRKILRKLFFYKNLCAMY